MRHTAGLVLIFYLMITAAVSARAEALPDVLYQTQAIVTGTGEVNRQLGFETCLRGVLVKVSGDQRVLDEPAVAAEMPGAGRYIASFRYRDRLEGIPVHDEQGTHDRPHDLTCLFDRARIDGLLKKVGHKPWLAQRPHFLVFLDVRTATKTFVLTRDGNDSPYMRDSLRAAAEPLALAAEVPDAATAKAAGLDHASLPKADWQRLAEIAAQAGGAVPLRGSLVWSDAELGWIARWQIAGPDGAVEWGIRGVSFDEAFRNAMAGALQVLSGNGTPG